MKKKYPPVGKLFAREYDYVHELKATHTPVDIAHHMGTDLGEVNRALRTKTFEEYLRYQQATIARNTKKT